MIWEVFRQRAEGADFVYCRDVHAPDREMAKQFAVIQHGRRKPTHALWVVPKNAVVSVAADADPDQSIIEAESVTWEVFSPDTQGYHTHVGSVSAPDEAGATQAAVDEFGEDDEELWVLQDEHVGEVTADEVEFGGTTNKDYRFAQTYNVDPAAEEVRESESEQVEARRSRGDG
jgi:ring-1,2-phenylacetyl-CoA epoxidase subunit PaaB